MKTLKQMRKKPINDAEINIPETLSFERKEEFNNRSRTDDLRGRTYVE